MIKHVEPKAIPSDASMARNNNMFAFKDNGQLNENALSQFVHQQTLKKTNSNVAYLPRKIYNPAVPQ